MSTVIFLDEQLEHREVKRLEWSGEPPPTIDLPIPYPRNLSVMPSPSYERLPQLSSTWRRIGVLGPNTHLYVGTMIPRPL